jgi:hypothetical protein
VDSNGSVKLLVKHSGNLEVTLPYALRMFLQEQHSWNLVTPERDKMDPTSPKTRILLRDTILSSAAAYAIIEMITVRMKLIVKKILSLVKEITATSANNASIEFFFSGRRNGSFKYGLFAWLGFLA